MPITTNTMASKNNKSQLLQARNIILLILMSFSISSHATIVQFQTAFGNFEVNLYDQKTPKTVANFLTYLNDGDYTNTVIHRSVPSFIIQGGGYNFDESWPIAAIPTNAAIVNEPVYSNVRGTISMAKLENSANSATNQWFFNLKNNSAGLDRDNSGYTVFGEVTGDGMAIIDSIAQLPRYNFGGAAGQLPLQNFTGTGNPDETNLVIISNIVILNPAVDTAAALNPPVNIGPAPVEESSGGGAIDLISLIGMLFGLMLLGLRAQLSRFRN